MIRILLVVLLLTGCTPIKCQFGGINEPPDLQYCDPQEVAFYESRGWDSWECHYDKTEGNLNYEMLGDVMDPED